MSAPKLAPSIVLVRSGVRTVQTEKAYTDHLPGSCPAVMLSRVCPGQATTGVRRDGMDGSWTGECMWKGIAANRTGKLVVSCSCSCSCSCLVDSAGTVSTVKEELATLLKADGSCD